MRGEDAVSPVLGGILLLAVVVSVGAVVFILTLEYGEDQDVAPQPTWTFDDNQDRILVARAPEALDWSRLAILTDKPVRFALNADPDDSSQLLTPGTRHQMSAQQMNAGDEVRFCGDGGLQTQVAVWFVDTELDRQASGFMKFRIIAACPAP